MPEVTGRLYEYVGERVRHRREHLGYTQDELAQRVMMARTSVTNVECGRQKLPLDALFRFAEALGVEVHDLVPRRSDLGDGGSLHVEVTIGTSRAVVSPRMKSALDDVLAGTGDPLVP